MCKQQANYKTLRKKACSVCVCAFWQHKFDFPYFKYLQSSYYYYILLIMASNICTISAPIDSWGTRVKLAWSP